MPGPTVQELAVWLVEITAQLGADKLTETIQHLSTNLKDALAMFSLAKYVLEKGEDAQMAITLAEKAAALPGYCLRGPMADIFCPIAQNLGDTLTARRIALKVFEKEATITNYKRLKTLYGDYWGRVQKDVLQFLFKQDNTFDDLKLEVCIMESQVDKLITFISEQTASFIVRYNHLDKLIALPDSMLDATFPAIKKMLEKDFSSWSGIQQRLNSYNLRPAETIVTQFVEHRLQNYGLELLKLRADCWSQRLAPTTYVDLARFLKQVKEKFAVAKKTAAWDQYFGAIKHKHRNKTNFMKQLAENGLV